MTPTTFADGDDGACTSNHCTLREALDGFNAATVNLLPGTYELSIPQPIQMQGVKTLNGAGATIDGNDLSGVLFLAETANATINDVVIVGGNAGTLQSVPDGGGIYIQSPSTLSLNRSTVSGNHAAATGGGIFSQSNTTVEINGSTIAANTAGVAGTGGEGAGIYGEPGSELTLTNSTVSGNQNIAGRLAAGAGIAAAGSVSLLHVTIAGNVPAGTGSASSLAIGGQSSLDTAAISNTIVVADTGSACLISSGRTTTGDHNLDDDGTCGFSRLGDRPGVNPLLEPLRNNGGPTTTHALLAGSPAIGGANPATCSSTDQRGVARPQEGTCDIGAFEYAPPPASPPPPPPPPLPPPDDPLPAPVAGKRVNVLPKSGKVRIKLRGRKRFRRLKEGEQVPVGTTVDTRNGRVTLVAASNKSGGKATSDFYGGIFKIAQTKGRRPITTLTLTEKLSCARPKGEASTAAKRKKKRRLWGDGKGRFRTKGKYSSATVRGTKWLVQDKCTSTLTRVVRGRVAVRDFAKKKTVIVRRGKRYVAKQKK